MKQDKKDSIMGTPVSNEFRKELEKLINKHSCENGSNTPDFILARYILDCLEGFDRAVNARSQWYDPNNTSTIDI